MTMRNYLRAAYALLRVTLGSTFPTTGVGNFAVGLQQQFADERPMFIPTPFAYALPFIGRLRKKIGDPPLIHTVRYVGYTIRESP